jgi:serine/threonine-protein phosphatase 2A regulatory subunit B''
MSYYDFVWFLISEEDKRNQTSIEYWFRVLDIDGDGVLSMYELEYFYNEQIELMKDRQIEFMPFNDLLCQVNYFLSNLLLDNNHSFLFY